MAKSNNNFLYVKKILGSYVEVSKEEQNKATMVVVEKGDFFEYLEGYVNNDKITKELQSQKVEYKELVSKYNKLVNNYNNNITNKVESANKKADEAIEKYNEIREENEVLKRQNASLHRQYIQTVNKQKGLTPAKSHSGYCLIQDNPKSLISKQAGKIAQFREAIISTPYKLNMDLEEAEEFVLNEITSKEITNKLNLGEKSKKGNVNDYIYGLVSDIDFYKESDCYFYCGLRMNTKNDCWEIVIYHPEPITRIPEDMKPESLIKKDKQKKKEKTDGVILEDEDFELL